MLHQPSSSPTVFPARKGAFLTGLLFLIVLMDLVLGWLILRENELGLLNIFLLALPVILLLWVLFGTFYKVKNKELFYRSAFLSGTIDIDSIEKLEVNRTMWVGVKPATALKGIIIHSRNAGQIYVSPIDNQALAEALLAINPQIRVISF